jgi:hypothetical protein
MIPALVISAVAVAFSGAGHFDDQAATTVFRGRPAIKISEGGIERMAEPTSGERAINVGAPARTRS